MQHTRFLALVIAFAPVQTIRTLACRSRGVRIHTTERYWAGLEYSCTEARFKKKNNQPLSHLGAGHASLHAKATVFGHHSVRGGLAVVVSLAEGALNH